MRKHTYNVHLKEFVKLFKSLASNIIYTITRRLDLLFKALHHERKRRKERILNSAFWDYNFNFHKMIDIHSKYDKMHKNCIFMPEFVFIIIEFHVWIACYHIAHSFIAPLLISHLLAHCLPRATLSFSFDPSISPYRFVFQLSCYFSHVLSPL